MYLSSRKVNILSKLFAMLAEPSTEHEIRARVGSLILDLFDADYYASYVWCDESKRFDGRISINMDDSNLKNYERYYQFHDPITPLLQARRGATLVTQVMPHAELLKTEFFNDFLGKDGLYWGINMYAWTDNENIGDMRIWRGRGKTNFDENDIQLLELIKPAFTVSLQRARDTFGAEETTAPGSCYERNHVLTESLSDREYQIAELAAKGLSDKEIARQLGIGFTTVRTHINSAFEKLQVNNRVKLAQIFWSPA